MGLDAVVYVVPRSQMSVAQISRLAYELGAAFGHDRFWREGDEHHVVDATAAEHGIELVTNERQVLEVLVNTRYWGPGYERGDLSFLLVLGRWLEEKVGAPYYGDDSGGGIDSFDATARDALWRHFVAVGNPYFQRSTSGDVAAPPCPNCDNAPTSICSWGPRPRLGATCLGCDSEWVYDGTAWSEKETK